MASSEKTPFQPIHPAIRDKLDPEYVAFHDAHLQYVVPSELEPWDSVLSRSKPSPTTIWGAQRNVDVGSVEDRDLGNFQVRVFTPESKDESGSSDNQSKPWPVLIWFHGGGFVMGGLGSENAFLRHVCKHVSCVVITINYRHAPEHVFPAAISDCVAGYQWTVNHATEFNIDTTQLVVGGLSAGGCLAAVLSLKIADLGLETRPKAQVLICPVIDNTADEKTEEGRWYASRHSPWLTPDRMRWYREKYFTSDASVAGNWDASPCFAAPELLAQSPRTWVAAGECDLLAPEALHYAELLRGQGVETSVDVYKGATHSVLLLAGIHAVSRQLVHDACRVLAKELGTAYDADTAVILGPDSREA